jgi:nucleoside-diphosphate-sugar epimerase
MTVLITGKNGFTGHYMQALLEKEGFSTVGLSYGKNTFKGDISCDLLDKAALKSVIADIKPTHVIHLAALSFVMEENEEAYYRTNLFGTQNLLEALAALKTPPQKIVIPSSANVYGLLEADRLKESACPAPVNHYGMSKLAMEHMARTWFDRLPIVITRPFNYTGPGQDTRFLVPKIVDHFRRQQATIELGNINVSRDFLDVRDVVAVYLSLLNSSIHSEIINICSGTGMALQEIIHQMNKIAGYEINISVNPAFIRNTEISRLVGDNSKLKQLLKFSPQFTLEQTLQNMYVL